MLRWSCVCESRGPTIRVLDVLVAPRPAIMRATPATPAPHLQQLVPADLVLLCGVGMEASVTSLGCCSEIRIESIVLDRRPDLSPEWMSSFFQARVQQEQEEQAKTTKTRSLVVLSSPLVHVLIQVARARLAYT